MRRAPSWVSPVARNDTEEVRRICAQAGELLPLWYQKKLPIYTMLGWAIECKHSKLVRMILKWRPELQKQLCYIPDWGHGQAPVQWACAQRNWPALGLCVDPQQRSNDIRQCERNVKARRAALFVLGALRKMGVLRDVCVLIARAVYATRGEWAWFYCLK